MKNSKVCYNYFRQLYNSTHGKGHINPSLPCLMRIIPYSGLRRSCVFMILAENFTGGNNHEEVHCVVHGRVSCCGGV